MNKYEMLEEIVKKIDYKSKYTINTKDFKGIYKNIDGSFEEISIQEFIFNQKFMNSYIKELHNRNYDFLDTCFEIDLMEKLDNPIEYLYNLIK